MTAEELAKLHAACFSTPRPWSATEFAQLLLRPTVFVVTSQNGFALGQVAGPEAELLTIAVHPNAQSHGEGRSLLHNFIDSAAQLSAQEIFLEVAETNLIAVALYKSAGFAEIGQRKGYFLTETGSKTTATVMKLTVSDTTFA